MFSILTSIAPIFLLILLGNYLLRKGIPSVEFWNLNDKLAYWVLFPALLFHNTSTLKLTGHLLEAYAIVTLGAFGAAVLYAVAVKKITGLTGAVGSSVLQGASRHNTFVSLAVSGQLFGAEGLALATLVTAVLVPVTNIVVVSLMTGMLPQPGAHSLGRAILRDLSRNPLLVSIVIGLSMNALGLGGLPVIHETTGLLGAAALPIVLLCIGANLRIREMHTSLGPVLLSIVGKFVIFPAAAFGLILATGLTGMTAVVPMIAASIPTAASSFTLARQMGGDAPLMAAIVTLQTLVSFVTLPLMVYWAGTYFGLTF